MLECAWSEGPIGEKWTRLDSKRVAISCYRYQYIFMGYGGDQTHALENRVHETGISMIEQTRREKSDCLLPLLLLPCMI